MEDDVVVFGCGCHECMLVMHVSFYMSLCMYMTKLLDFLRYIPYLKNEKEKF